MSNSSAENPVPVVLTFTARGNAALDQLAEALVAECDGSAKSIADLLEQVLKADIEDLADSLSQSAQPAPRANLDVEEIRPPAETPGRRCASPALDPVAVRRRQPRCTRHGHPALTGRDLRASSALKLALVFNLREHAASSHWSPDDLQFPPPT
jgi:hypothetical protein